MKNKFLQIISACLFLQILLVSELCAQRNVEQLDRGLVAVQTGDGIFLSWRVFGYDPADVAFNIYRNGTLVNTAPITGASNMVDAAGAASSTYTVRPVIGGTELGDGGSATVWADQVLEINLSNRPSTNHKPNDINIGDLDGDGQYELVVKWYPNNAQDNSNEGNTDNTFLAAYKLDGTFLWIIDLGQNIRSGAHYTQHLVGDYNLDGYAEVACKTAPGTKDGTGEYLSMGPAANDDDGQDYANGDGFVLRGPEYLTIFNGQTGEEMATVNYIVQRGSVSAWGDSYGNRLDRYNSTNAYLDGVKPSMIFQRGYYTRMVIAAWDWDGTTLSNRWTFDSNDAGNGSAAGDGNHSIMAGDVDGDGFDEIIPGAACIDHNGTLLWNTGLGHGDANHIGDFDPDNPGLEIFQVHEGNRSEVLVNASNGNVFWRNPANDDNGRGMTADMDASHRGHEMWSSNVGGVKTYQNDQFSTNKPAINFRIYWDGDLLDEIPNGNGRNNLDNRIEKWNGNGTTRTFELTGYSCNGTKATPNLSADIIGDWREEIILHDNASKLYLHTTTIPTEFKMYTLMHDPLYRNAISWQQSSYNQPPHLSFWLAGVETPPIPNIIAIGGEDCNGVEGGTAFIDQCGTCVGGNTGLQACYVDCNGDEDGTATLDDCGVCSGGNTGRTACMGAIQAENYCVADGVVETVHTGYTGEGYLNFDNTEGATGTWNLYSLTESEVTLTFVLANGGDAPRSMNISVNGAEQAVLSGAETGDWTNYTTEDITLNLSTGINSIQLTAIGADGGPNIDAIFINDEGISVIGCDVQTLQLRAGWNIVGYPFQDSADLETALSNILPYVEVVKDMTEFYVSDQQPFLNSLQQLQWSHGYLIKVSQDCELIWEQ